MKRIGTFLTGAIIGGMLATGMTAYAAGILAEKSMVPFFLNGSPVEVDAYLIHENNYFKLRDIAALADFGVTWDAETGSVYIDTTVGYTPVGREEPADVSREAETVDYSAQANPAIFTGPYTKEAYNALREAMVTGHGGPVSMTEGTRLAMINAEAAACSYPNYELKSLGDGIYEYIEKRPQTQKVAAENCRVYLSSLAGKTDEEKLFAFACKVAEGLEYQADAWTAPGTFFSQQGPHKGNCTSYSHNFKFLCDLADLPCVLVHSDDHQWNEVYVNGSWYCVDITGFDVAYTTSSVTPKLLYNYSEKQSTGYQQSDPLLTQVAKELLVPNSTK